ncbi:unnamed protein product [Mytilus edulis]|uniref:Uncharacterized protein n=1 Tax=Mytilus edulis TaxID=6550 RepID=A0A8S3TWI1_MYTED|nr:unnamed protein product [Mytilus edulis]
MSVSNTITGLSDGQLTGRWNDGQLTGRWNDGQLTGRLNDGHLNGRLNDGHLIGRLNDGHLTGRLNDGQLTGRWNDGQLTGRRNDGQLTGRLNRGHQDGALDSGKRLYRSRRSAVQRLRVSYRGNRGSTRNHFDSGRFNRLGGNSGWRSNSGYNSRWYKFESFLRQLVLKQLVSETPSSEITRRETPSHKTFTSYLFNNCDHSRWKTSLGQ